ncbi:MAG: hypothetical protein Q8S54_17215 [Bacteroidota bacterium]|nr:hypothetical protein [Bacteroidota bacterium]
MFKKLNNYLEKRFIPRWMVLMIDISLVTSSFLFTYLLRFELFSGHVDLSKVIMQLLAGFPIYLVAVSIFKPHRGIIRHSTTYDTVMVLRTQLVLSTGFFLISYYGREFHVNLVIPWSVIIVHFLLSVFLMVSFRFAAQYVFRNLLMQPNDTIKVMIYGAGVLGNISKSVIMKEYPPQHYRLTQVGFCR